MTRRLTWQACFIPAFLLANLILHSLLFGALNGVAHSVFSVIGAVFGLFVAAVSTLLSGVKPILALILSPLTVIAVAFYIGVVVRDVRIWQDPEQRGSATLCGIFSFACVAIGLNVILGGPVLALIWGVATVLIHKALAVDPDMSPEQNRSRTRGELIICCVVAMILSMMVLVLAEKLDKKEDLRQRYAHVEYSLDMPRDERESMDKDLRILISAHAAFAKDLLPILETPLSDAVEHTPKRLSFSALKNGRGGNHVLTCTFHGTEIRVSKRSRLDAPIVHDPSVVEKLIAQSLCARYLTRAQS